MTSTARGSDSITQDLPATPKVVNQDAVGGTRPHLAYIDSFRALAALYVVAVHVLRRAWGTNAPRSAILRIVAKCTSGGHFAVTAFIVISGFCLMLPVVRQNGVLRGGARRFFVKRFWRIAPPLYIAFVLSAAMLQVPRVRLVYGVRSHITLTQVISHLLLLQFPTPGGLLPNAGILWSISVECVMYLFFPILVAGSGRIGIGKITLIYILTGYAVTLALRDTIVGQFTWQYLGAFALGAWSAQVAFGNSSPSGKWSRFPWLTLAASCFCGVVLFIAIAGWKRADELIWLFDLPIAFSSAALLIGASRPGHNWTRKFLEFPLLVWIGFFSYSLYMIHYPLADVLEQYLLAPLRHGQLRDEMILLFVFFPVLILSAYVFFLICERPFHILARRAGRG